MLDSCWDMRFQGNQIEANLHLQSVFYKFLLHIHSLLFQNQGRDVWSTKQYMSCKHELRNIW